MVKKSRRQREGTGRFNPYNIVEQDVSGQDSNSVETSVACDESSSTMFKPEASKKSRGILRLKRKTSQYKSSKLEGGSEDSLPHSCPSNMHAVANGERMEAFKNGERETTNGDDGTKPLVATDGDSGKRPTYERPCPKSRKSRDDANRSETYERARTSSECDPEPILDVAGTTEAGYEMEEEEKEVREEKEADNCGEVQEPEEEQHISGGTEECNVEESREEPSVNGIEGSEHETEGSKHKIEGSEEGIEGSENGIEGSEPGIEGSENGIEGSEPGIEGSENGIEGSEHGIEVSEHGIEGSENGIEGSEHGIEGSEPGIEGSEHGNEGIVTEPEDHVHADQESCSLSDPDVTISYLEGEEEGCDPEREVDSPGESEEPLIEFPMDSPSKTSTPHLSEAMDFDVDDDIDSDHVAGDNLPDTEEDSPDISMERGYKVLHRLINPTQYCKVASESDRKEQEPDFSFGRSLRSLSGRRSMRPGREEKEERESSPTETGSPSFFGFGLGKRKSQAMEEEGREHETKRAKVDEGVDSLGLFARLTSPVINRLRAIRVGSPFRSPGQEVNGHEEMAVSIIPTAQPAATRCVLM